MNRSRWILVMGLGVAACDLPDGGERRDHANGSVTSTTTSTTGTSTTGTSTTSPDPEPMPEPMPEPPPPVCGDGKLDPGEQCDDGGNANLDGCDAACGFEQIVRFNALEMRFTTDTLCRANAIGGAVGSAAQATLQESITGAVRSGSISTLCAFRELRSFDGGDTSSTVGCVTGTPVANASYNGASDLDWWYTVSSADLDADLIPVARLGATIRERSFSAGPGNILLSLNLGGGGSQLRLSSVLATAAVGAASTPRVHVTLPRGHRPEENLDPALTTFASLTGGRLCGNVSAESLATLPIPEILREGGQNACWEGYTENNSMLDVFVGGCSVFWVTVIAATQPDQFDPGLPPAGNGAPYQLVAGTDKTIERCNDSGGRRVTLSRCLKAAAYSVAVRFNAGRVMITGVDR